MIRESSRGSNV
uniref:Uncharacterized protein n=1 Tax=Anopheles minimus TaxID=112268 RepID=A0A182WN72_9DIPT